MNIRVLSAFLPITLAIFSSCSDAERDGGRNRIVAQSHVVKYKIYSTGCSDPLSKMYVSHDDGEEFFIHDGIWEKEIVTKGNSAKISAHYMQCDALINGEIYVDGKLKVASSHNKEMEISYSLK